MFGDPEPDLDAWRVQQVLADSVFRSLMRAGIVPTSAPARRQERPTQSDEAYSAYLQGLDRLGGNPATLRTAAEFFSRAVELDSTFAQAWAGLSRAYSNRANYTLPEATGASALTARRVAHRLAPDHPETHLAVAAYEDKILRDYPVALDYLRFAAESLPDDPEVFSWRGSTLRRAGRYEEALAAHQTAEALNPTDPGQPYDLATTHLQMRHHAEALRSLNRYYGLIERRFPVNFMELIILRSAGWTDSLRARLTEWDGQDPSRERWWHKVGWVQLAMLEGDYEEAVRLAEPLDRKNFVALIGEPVDLRLALAHERLGDPERARLHYDSARVVLEAWQDSSYYLSNHSDLSVALAGLGNREDALEAGRYALERTRDEWLWEGTHVRKFARALTLLGEHDEALDRIGYLLSVPAGGWMSVAMLRDEAEWVPLREHPRYDSLLVEYGGEQGGR
jgi:tetratricopeptide (TPR) repeat protein